MQIPCTSKSKVYIDVQIMFQCIWKHIFHSVFFFHSTALIPSPLGSKDSFVIKQKHKPFDLWDDICVLTCSLLLITQMHMKRLSFEPIVKVLRRFFKNWLFWAANRRPSWILSYKNRSNHKTDFKNEFLDPQNPKIHILCGFVGRTIAKLISNMADGSHFGSGALTDYAHTFARGMGAKFCI